jgi:hypothetical protein
MNKNLYKNGIITLYLSRQPQYTVRQYYAQGGIATLVPRKGFFLGGIGDFIGDALDFGGDVIGGIGDFAGDVLDSPIGRIGLTLLAPQLGLPMWAASAGLAAYDLATKGTINPLSLAGAAMGASGFDGFNLGGAESAPVDWTGLETIQSGISPDAIAPSGIFAGDLGPINPIQNIGGSSLTYNPYQGLPTGDLGTGASSFMSNYTPTQNYINNSIYNPVDESGGYFSGTSPESPFTQVAQSREQILGGDIPKPGYFGTTYENLKTAFDPTSSTSAMDRLRALGDVGSDTFKALYEKKDGSMNVPAVLATLSLYPSYMAAKQKANELGVPFDEAAYQAGKVDPYKAKYASMAPKSAFGLRDGGRIGYGDGGMSNSRVTQLLQLLQEAQLKGDFDTVDIIKAELYSMKKANGGRIGYEQGKLVLPKDNEGPNNKRIRLEMERAAKKAQEEYARRKMLEQLMDKNYDKQSMYDWKRDQKELFDAANETEFPPLPTPVKPEGVLSIKLTPAQGKKKGGKIVPREGHFLGNIIKGSGVVEPSADGNVSSGGGLFGGLIQKILQQNPQIAQKQPYVPTNRPVNDLYQYYLNKENDEAKRQAILKQVMPLFGVNKAHGGMIDYPIRMLHGGTPELDLRAKGGYIPYGVKEKADDVPAMLSKNEFVFTADAVKGAGGGSVNKGAIKMYKLMKSLEKKTKKQKVA